MHPFKKKIRLAFSHPHLTIMKIRSAIRTRLLTKWDYQLRKGSAHSPDCVCLKLTYEHNYPCPLCGHKKMLKAGTFDARRESELALDDYRRMLDDIKLFKPTIFIRQCGEPFLYPDVIPLLTEIKKRTLTCQINTDGYDLEQHAGALVELGVDDLIISMDGPAHIQNEKRGLPDSFERAFNGVMAVHREKQKQRAKKPMIRVRGMIDPENADNLTDFINIAKEFQADALTFLWMWFTDDESGKEHENVMQSLFDMKAPMWQYFRRDPDSNNQSHEIEKIRSALNAFHQADVDFPIIISPKVEPENVYDYFTNTTRVFGSERCYSVWNKTYIMPDGDVSPCPHYTDVRVGNIKNSSLMKIWNGERYRQWRQQLQKHGRFPICYRCCDLADTEII